MSFGSKVIWFARYWQVFSNLRAVRDFAALRKSAHPAEGEVGLGVRQPPGATLICRSGSTDAAVLWEVFWGRSHMPPGPLPERPVIFDLGANVGYTCFDFAKQFPGARIYGVEMDLDNVALARRNTAKSGPDCHIIHAAIWWEDGEVSYSKDAEEWGYEISGDGAPGDAATVTVRAMSVETLMSEAGVDRVDYLKMDIEGAENEVLRPDAGWLQNVDVINLEIHAPATYDACEQILSQAGFRCAPSARHKHAIMATRF